MISVIVPVYKVERYLNRCVQSIVDQSDKDLEIILVDDGYPDRCPQMCDEWAKKDSRIKVVHKKNGGLSSARNAGIKVAKGEYIGFVDSDDYIDESMYEDLMHIMRLNPKAMIASYPIVQDAAGILTPYKVGTYAYKYGDVMPLAKYMKLFLKRDIDATVWNKLYKRDFIHTLFREGRNNEDFLFMYYNVKRLFNSEYLFASSSNAHYHYRVNEQGICHQSATSVNRLFFDELYNMVEILNDVKQWNPGMTKLIIPSLEGKLINACDQILKFPVIQEKRLVDCNFIKSILFGERGYIRMFRKGRPLLSSLKLFLFRYFPSIYLMKAKK